jgi:hypothetical protein
MRVGFVLRSAEIKPLFYDLFIESILCISSHLCVYIYIFFGIERRDVFLSHENHSACSAIPPPPSQYPTHDFLFNLTFQVGHECHVYGCPHVCSVRACVPHGSAPSHAHTQHYSIMQETTVLSTGFDSQLAMNTATLRRQHRIPSDLRS